MEGRQTYQISRPRHHRTHQRRAPYILGLGGREALTGIFPRAGVRIIRQRHAGGLGAGGLGEGGQGAGASAPNGGGSGGCD